MTKADNLIQSGETLMWLYKPIENQAEYATHTHTGNMYTETHP